MIGETFDTFHGIALFCSAGEMKNSNLLVLLVLLGGLWQLTGCSNRPAQKEKAVADATGSDNRDSKSASKDGTSTEPGNPAKATATNGTNEEISAGESTGQQGEAISKQREATGQQLDGADREKQAARELAAINESFDQAVKKLNEEIAGLSTVEEKQELFDARNPEPDYTRNLLGLARKYPQTDSAFTAAMSIIVERPTSLEFPATMDLVLDNFGGRVQWHKLAEGYLEVVPSQQVEGWLRKMISTASTDEIRVRMTYLLYRYFDQFPTFASTIEYNPQLKKRFPEQQVAYIYDRKREVVAEMLSDLKELKDKYPDVMAINNRTVRDVIDGPIFELENLQVGSLAPDIVGQDFDGIDFKLSDYRGKVVMLDFWGQWCPPCRAMFPHERDLIEQLVGKPFVLLGVNSDRLLKTAIKATQQENLVWRNFWCGPKGRSGPIPKKWNVSAWPTVYLIDGKGIIRYKEVLGTDIDRGIEKLLSEMGFRTAIARRAPARKSSLAIENPRQLFSVK